MITYIYAFSYQDELEQFILSHKLSENSVYKEEIILVNRCFVMSKEQEKDIRNKAEVAGFGYVRQSIEESISKGYKEALNDAQGDMVCFTVGGAQYDAWLTEAVERTMESYPEMGFCEVSIPKNIKQIPPEDVKRNLNNGEVIDVDEIEIPEVILPQIIVKASIAKELGLKDLSDADVSFDFCIRLQKKYNKHISLTNCNLILENEAEDIFVLHSSADTKEYYKKAIEEAYLPILEETAKENGSIPKWMQLNVFYGISEKLLENYNNAARLALNETETDEFLALVAEVTQYLDDDIIMDNVTYKKSGIRFHIRNLLCNLKYNSNETELDRKFVIKNQRLFFKQRGIEYNISRDRKIIIKTMHVLENQLVITGWFLTHMLYDYDHRAIICEVNGKEVDLVHKDYYALDKVFGRTINKKYVFEVTLPLEELFEEDSRIVFYLNIGGIKSSLPLDFNRMPSKLSNYCEHRYWQLGDSHILTYSDNTIWVSKIKEQDLMELEEKYQKDAALTIRKIRYDEGQKADSRKEGLVIKLNGRVEAKKLIDLRNKYYKEKKKLGNRRIWLYFDKLFKGGDNGEYAFRYAYKNDRSIECYYVINKDAPDYGRLKREFGNRILVFGEEKTKLYALLAETVVATHPDIMEFFGYTGHELSLMKNLFNPYLVCIAHGVTIQKNADYQNKLFDDTMFYTTSSKYEVNHILHPIYGYREQDVALTGMARFDGLVNNDKKQILITPTWRRSLVGTSERNTTREYNPMFKKTSYFRVYNSLINDDRIIESAKRNGYKVIFLVHPSMSTQLKDYDKNDYVEMIPAAGDMSYEKILTESSLMVTDYSGIHYDFGYMRKPVIYYQPKEVPIRFEEGGMKFAAMGFGPLTTEYEEVVQLIADYMDNNCEMPEEYKKRADDFFAFDDHNNCQRIHEAIKDWVDKNNNLNALL